MIDVAITVLPPAPLHALEIWSAPAAVADRFEAATGFALPPMGRAAGSAGLRLMRTEPTVWLVEGDPQAVPAILAGDGALTSVGGGLVGVRLSGPGWRRLLMEGGVFDAEAAHFAPGNVASTIIDHVNVRLHVVATDTCDAYVPLSYCVALLDFWGKAIEAGD